MLVEGLAHKPGRRSSIVALVRRIVPKVPNLCSIAYLRCSLAQLSTPRHFFNPGPCPCGLPTGLVLGFQELASGTAVDVVVNELALDPAALVAEPVESFGISTALFMEPLFADIDGSLKIASGFYESTKALLSAPLNALILAFLPFLVIACFSEGARCGPSAPVWHGLTRPMAYERR